MCALSKYVGPDEVKVAVSALVRLAEVGSDEDTRIRAASILLSYAEMEVDPRYTVDAVVEGGE